MAMLKALGEDPTVQLYSSDPPWEGAPAETRLGEPERRTPNLTRPLLAQSPNIPSANGCGSNGTVFNLEPATNAVPQFSEAVDFFYNGVAAGADLVAEGATDFGVNGTVYYVHTATAGCAPAFQGSLPDITPGLSGETDSGHGEAAVIADAQHSFLYMADIHNGSNGSSGTTAVGLFRAARADLLNTAKCPAGTHTAAQAKTCWPLSKLINPLPGPFGPYQQDVPSLAADFRVLGVGAANVYVTGTEFDFNAGNSRIWLVACTYFFSCSSPVVISGSDTGAQFSNVQVRPDGGVTISYVNKPSNSKSGAIKYVACLPQGAPVTPSCAPPVLVLNDPAPLSGGLIAEQFLINTFPKHAHRVDAGVTQTFVVWDRCKVISTQDFCPDADLLMKVSTNNGLTWGPLVFFDNSADDQFFPAISTDASRKTVNIAYYSNHGDPLFQHRINVILKQILPGSTAPTAAVLVTATPNDPSSDLFFIGPQDYIGVSARGTGAAGQSRIYIGFTSNLRQGTYAGVAAPQADNYVTRLIY
jgi:hypothetical protein